MEWGKLEIGKFLTDIKWFENCEALRIYKLNYLQKYSYSFHPIFYKAACLFSLSGYP